ncbi:DUF6172 family protein [Photobacterium nomapromontoriensis]|uniref:DUF6172 family protein n=1 Tax=Photobacterium nomapromontoriensis TaxID=2910237 RepID=UPI003D0C4A52
MKKTFALTHPKKAVPRVVEAVKYEVKKYLKRERNKTLPTGADYWDFDCRFGHTEQEAKVIHVKEINKCIDEAEALALTSFYLEILAKPAARQKRIEADDE